MLKEVNARVLVVVLTGVHQPKIYSCSRFLFLFYCFNDGVIFMKLGRAPAIRSNSIIYVIIYSLRAET